MHPKHKATKTIPREKVGCEQELKIKAQVTTPGKLCPEGPCCLATTNETALPSRRSCLHISSNKLSWTKTKNNPAIRDCLKQLVH